MMYSAILSFLILLVSKFLRIYFFRTILFKFQVVLNEFSLANSYHRYFCPNCFKRSEYPLRFKIFNRFGNEDCVHQICDDDETYPYKTIETKMKESMEFKKYFGTIIEPHRKPTITNRFGEVDNSNLTNMCKTAYHTRYPKVAINKEGLEKYIVNTEEFKQAVSFETCA